MKIVFKKLNNHILKPAKDWLRKFWDKGDDNDPYGNNPYVIL